MKKIVTIAAVALLGAIVLPSCKKDYTCSCTVTGMGITTTAEGKTGKMSKKDAKAECDKGDYSANGITSECEIK